MYTRPVISPLSFGNSPLNDTTPFTYRDAYTYQQKLYDLNRYLNETVVKGIGDVEDWVEWLFQFLNNKTGNLPIQYVDLTENLTLEIDNTWPTEHIHYIMFRQNVVGGWDVTAGENIIGSIDVEQMPETFTFCWLVPRPDGKWELETWDSAMARVVNTGVQTRAAIKNLISEYDQEFIQPRLDELENTLLTAMAELEQRVNTKLAELETWVNQRISELDASKVTRGDEVVSVTDYGADKTGATDSTSAFKAAVAKLVRGGTLLVPPGKYLVNGEVVLPSNTHVSQYGAEIVKTSAQSSYVVYALVSKNKTGRGAGARNVTISGGTLRGDLASGATINLLTAHRARGIRVRDVEMVEYAANGHAIDLMGCDDVVIEACSFRGFNPLPGREHTEAIQLDSSIKQGAGFSAATIASEVWDGTATRDVLVRDCVFEGSGSYPGQSPIGSHTWVIDRPMTNIRFVNNIVRNTVSVVTSSYPAILHFIGTTDILVQGNIFEGVSGRMNRVMRANRGERGIPLSQVSADSPVWEDAGTKVNISRVKFLDNEVINMSDNLKPSDDAPHLIHFYGRDDYSITDITIARNSFRNCQTLGSESGYLIQLGDTVSARVTDNWYDRANGFLYVGNSRNPLVTGNVGVSNSHYPVNAKGCFEPMINNNNFYRQDKGIIASECLHPTISNNIVEVLTDFGGVHVVATPPSASLFTINGNKVIGYGSKTTNGIQATPSNYPKGVAIGNICTGYSNPFEFAATASTANNVS